MAVHGLALGPVAAGSEFQVNTYTIDRQGAAAVATDSAGNFVVVWNSYSQDGNRQGVFGQRYASSGAMVGSEFQVNTFTPNDQGGPAVASDPAGDFVVVWQSYTQDGDQSGIFGQRYASSGAMAGSEFQVNTVTMERQQQPKVASDLAGNFVVVYRSATDGSLEGVFGQRFAGSGAKVGSEFPINSYTTNNQIHPGVASDLAGNFVVVWDSTGQDGDGYGVFGQRFASNGAKVGGEFQINTYTNYKQGYPAVASDSEGNFVVVWRSSPDGNYYDVFGQRFASNGAQVGSEFQINTYTFENQSDPAVASDPAGNFLVTWSSFTPDGDGHGVFGQRYASNGAQVGSEFQINTYTIDDQERPAVASGPAANFVVVWESDTQDGDRNGVFGQRLIPAAAPPSGAPVLGWSGLAVLAAALMAFGARVLRR